MSSLSEPENQLRKKLCQKSKTRQQIRQLLRVPSPNQRRRQSPRLALQERRVSRCRMRFPQYLLPYSILENAEQLPLHSTVTDPNTVRMTLSQTSTSSDETITQSNL